MSEFTVASFYLIKLVKAAQEARKLAIQAQALANLNQKIVKILEVKNEPTGRVS